MANPVISQIDIGDGNMYEFKGGGEETYRTSDSASTSIDDTDYIPISTSTGEKKKSLWSNIKSILSNVFASKSDSIKNITRSGTTFTATRADDTTFTFDQQDSNTTYSIKEYVSTPANLAAFVQATATGVLIANFKFKDTNNVLGFGANTWIKGYIQYQNAYGAQYDVNGMGIASTDGGNPTFVKITGTGTSFTVTRRDLTQDTNTTTGTTYAYNTIPNNTTFGTNGSIKNIFDTLNSWRKYFPIFQNDAGSWQDTQAGYCSWYYYEGVNTSAYGLPYAYCIVIVYKHTSSRGVAFAVSWNNQEKRIWKNNLHDSWRGWLQITG